jgi:hypothetical protein
MKHEASSAEGSNNGYWLWKKKGAAQTAQEKESAGTKKRQAHLSNEAAGEELVLGGTSSWLLALRNASDERSNRRWVWRMGKASRDGDGLRSDRGAGAGTRKGNKAKQTTRSCSAVCLSFFLY